MILVVGDVMTDVIVRAAVPFVRDADTPAAITLRPGGSGANVASWLGHLGAPVAFAGRVGASDAAAQAARLAAHGVRARLTADPSRETGRIVAILGPDGERSFYTDRGANLALDAADLPDSLLDGCRHLHVSGHTLAGGPPRLAALGLIAGAAGRGIPASVDAGSAIYHRASDTLAAAWEAGAGLLFANAAEAALIGVPPATVTRVTTLGPGGARLDHAGTSLILPAPPAPVVDGIGAGDALVAGFLAARLRGTAPADCLAAGLAAAAQALGTAGGRPPSS